jgi:hypothetical protein
LYEYEVLVEDEQHVVAMALLQLAAMEELLVMGIRCKGLVA